MEHSQNHCFFTERLVAHRPEDRHAKADQNEVAVKQTAEDLKLSVKMSEKKKMNKKKSYANNNHNQFF